MKSSFELERSEVRNESIYLGKTVCVTGEICEHDGIPYIKVSSADKVKVLD